MRRLALLFCLLSVPAAAQVYDPTGALGVMTPDRTSTGALGALNAAVTVDAAGRSGVGGFVTTGTLVGTITPEVTVDGTNWLATSVYTMTAGTAPTRSATVTLNTSFVLEIPAGVKSARIRVSAFTSGSSTGTLIATASSGSRGAVPVQAVSGTVTANAGTGTFATDPVDEDARVLGRVKVHDGTDTALVTAGGLLQVDASGTTVPISAASLPLPTGAATEATLATRAADATLTGRLPAGSTPADNESNAVTITRIGTFPFVFDGTTWDRWTGAVNGTVTANAGSGTFTTSDTATGATGAAVPARAMQAGVSDGTNLVAPRSYDTDSGAGTQNTLGISLRKTASGGSVEAGTSTDPLRTDPTGTTTQPVSGTVTANAGTGTFTVGDGGGSLTVDAPVSTPVAVRVSDGAAFISPATDRTTAAGPFSYRPSDGTDFISSYDLDSGAGTVKGFAFSWRRTAAGAPEFGTSTDPVRTDPTGTTTQPVSGTVTANAGTGNFNVVGTKSNDGGAPGSTNLGILPAVATAAEPLYTAGNQVGLSINLQGRTRTEMSSWLGSVVPTIGQKVMASSIPVTISSDQSAVPASQSGTWTVQQGTPPWTQQVQDGDAAGEADVTNTPPATTLYGMVTRPLHQELTTATESCVTVTTTSTTLLASNTARRFAQFSSNPDTTTNIFVSWSGTAATTDFKFVPGAAWNSPTTSVYTGAIAAITSAGTQSVCVMEF